MFEISVGMAGEAVKVTGGTVTGGTWEVRSKTQEPRDPKPTRTRVAWDALRTETGAAGRSKRRSYK